MISPDINQATELTLEVGRILLTSGSATNRVELMMRKVSAGFGYAHTESFVTPTGIFITVSDGKDQLFTSIKRIEARRVDLGKITRISHLVQKLERNNSDPSLPSIGTGEFRRELEQIEAENVYPEWLRIFCGGATGGFFCLLFGGSWLEFGVAYLVGILVSLSLKLLSYLNINNFLLNALGAALVVSFAKLLDIWVPYIVLDKIIIGGIMLLVPGLSMVNAIRDTMSGDLVSGTARGMEAFFIAVAIATGSGAMLKLWAMWGF
jgi:uncharacterized membrane protein YjjP (DUF1212 family)